MHTRLRRPLVQARSPVGLLGVLLLLVMALPAQAEKIELEFPFELDEWFDIDHEDGPITIHRVRVESKANVKSRIFRPGIRGDSMIQDVQIQIEYTNRSARDVECELEVFWLDAEGRPIDGYAGEEDMNEEETDQMTAQRSTLIYGLEVAKTLSVKIEY